jgi:hypothetical protein
MSGQSQTKLFDFNPLKGGTPVKEVDQDSKLIGRQFLSFQWNTRLRPADRTDGCGQWINQIVVSEYKDGAKLGATLIVPNSTIASSSPYSRDVSVIVVDESGSTIEEFVAPYVLVPCSQPSLITGVEIAQEIWLSQAPFNPATTPLPEIVRSGCQPRHCP